MTEDQKEVAYQLLEYGAAVDKTIGSLKWTVLHAAISVRQLDVVEQLLFGFHANARKKAGNGINAPSFAQQQFEERKITQEIFEKILLLLLESIGRSPPIKSDGSPWKKSLFTHESTIKTLSKLGIVSIPEEKK
jgi:hypothetical protein